MPELHAYQKRGVEHLHAHPSSALWLPPGLGKTATTLRALTPEHLPVLVTGPKRVAETVWPVEHAKWRDDLSFALAAGTPAQRRKALRSGADVVVVGRDNLADAVGGPWKTFVIDESSAFKTRSTKRWKNGHKIAREADHVWELTGTPASSGLLDLWAQVYLLDGGKRLGKTLTQYRERYFTPGRQLASGVVTEWNIRPGADSQIHDLVSDLCLSMPEDLIDLPPVVFNTVSVPLPPSAADAYNRMCTDLVVDLTLLGEGAIHTAANAAVATNKLSQIACGFIYPDAEVGGPPTRLNTAKLDALGDLIDEAASPVLVFYRYAEEFTEMMQLPGARGLDSPNVLEDWNAGKVPLLLAHPASAAHGLNLQHGGHTAVWTSPPWSLELYLQANKRLARQGQRHRVVIHHLISPGTVDEAVMNRLAGRASVQEALLTATKGVDLTK